MRDKRVDREPRVDGVGSAGKTTRTQTQASHFRAALDGAPAAPGAKPRPRLGAALAALDVPALALSDDADAHRRLYELAVGSRVPRRFS